MMPIAGIRTEEKSGEHLIPSTPVICTIYAKSRTFFCFCFCENVEILLKLVDPHACNCIVMMVELTPWLLLSTV